MKNIIYYFSILLGVFTLASCEPNQDTNGDFLFGVDYTANTSTGTTAVLKQMTSHIKDDTGQFEDSSITYTYSGSKLVSFKDDSGETTKVDYNASGKISKTSSTSQTSVFEYSGTNLSNVVTTLTGIGKITATYSFTGGKLSKIISIQDFTLPFPIKTYYETTYEFTAENMTKSITKSGVYNPVTGDLEMSPEINTITFTYDTKKSPYKLIPLEYNLSLIGIAPQGGNYLSANNYLKVTVANSGASTEVTTFTHTYDSQNYPTKSTAGDEYISYKY